MSDTGSFTKLLQDQGYCCCGEDRGKEVIATLCPKHGSTVLNCGGTLEYALNDEMSAIHYAATGCKCRKVHGDRRECPLHGHMVRKITVKALRQMLLKYPDNAIVILASDEEQNDYGVLGQVQDFDGNVVLIPIANSVEIEYE